MEYIDNFDFLCYIYLLFAFRFYTDTCGEYHGNR